MQPSEDFLKLRREIESSLAVHKKRFDLYAQWAFDANVPEIKKFYEYHRDKQLEAMTVLRMLLVHADIIEQEKPDEPTANATTTG